MRIISGSLKGRVFETPRGHRTHPMGDRVKGALFNTLGDVKGLTVLDAYAGSGALSLEAVSRGATEVTAIDVDLEAYKTLSGNVTKLGLQDKILVMRKNSGGWARNHQDLRFDLVIADPPYDDIRPVTLQRLAHLVKLGGIFVLSWPKGEVVRPFEGMEVLKSNTYGGAQLVFYRRAS